MVLILTGLVLLSSELFSAEKATEVELSPIVREGTPTDALMDDAIAPIQIRRANPSSSTGSIDKEFSRETGMMSIERGNRGRDASIRGLGKSADDIDVQALGISLNPAQGSGLDLSIFPAFLWDTYGFTLGPSFGSQDSRGVGGSLILNPWTSAAMQSRYPYEKSLRVTGSSSTSKVHQFSGGYAVRGSGAVLAGYSLGDIEGPAGSLSARVGPENWGLKTHFLGTGLGIKSYNARGDAVTTQYSRVIPILQYDRPLSSRSILKTSLFYDNLYMGYDGSPFTRQRIQQIGITNALVTGDWKFGLSAQRVDYYSNAFDVPVNWTGSGQISRVFEFDAWTFEAALKAVSISAIGTYPSFGFAGGFGGRYDYRAQKAFAYFKASFAQQPPSLNDRYYSNSIGYVFIGNPNLKPESAWSLVAGYQLEPAPTLQFQSEFIGQYRTQLITTVQNAGVFTKDNLGEGHLLGSTLGVLWKVVPNLFELRSRTTGSWTRIYLLNQGFPFVPNYSHRFSGALLWKNWVFETGYKLVAEAQDPSRILPGYALLDMGLKGEVCKNTYLSISVDNIFDRFYEQVANYAGLTRTLTIGLTGEF